MMLYVVFQVLTAVVAKSYVLQDLTPCSPLEVNGRFGGTFRLHLQDIRIIQALNQLLDFFFVHEYGVEMFLRNVSCLSTGCYIPEDSSI
jgi:hypothetical protein